MTEYDITIVLPAKNEAEGLAGTLPALQKHQPGARILVVDDGSTDNTPGICRSHGVESIRHPYAMGNGAAIKAGIRAARTEIVICMDADGQHRAEDVAPLVEKLSEGYEMVVGARASSAQASPWRRLANGIYNRFAAWMVGHPVADLTSGMRAVRRERALEFLHLLPNGFSYPTTLTMAFFRAGYAVRYEPIQALQRKGKSHISPLRDGIRFLLIIFKVGTLYSPLKIFFPMSVVFFLTGFVYYLTTYFTMGRFTNMGALLFLTSIIVFLMGLISEQITSLLYQSKSRS